MKVFIIIPAYNEAASIGDVLRSLAPLGHRLVVVDDCSQDATAEMAQKGGAMVFSHCVNLGQGAALQTGFAYARQAGAEVIVTFDADGQHRPEDIAPLLEALENKQADVVLGSRFLGRAEGIFWLRKTLLKWMVHYTNITTGLR
ncbi:MAG: glycosyltransferase family 2 protein, partial [Rickettsiales bacterium]|nr:glycosyltransferase family 2 protein [Rickettsiales bacterium]